ncbi:hypothetical protein QTP88_010226 [Uroleucon formosanum]
MLTTMKKKVSLELKGKKLITLLDVKRESMFKIKQEKFLKKDDGSLMTNQEEIMVKRGEYFEKLLNCEAPVDTFAYGHNKPYDDPCLPPSKEEIEQQIKRLKNHKSPGEDDLQGDILKHAD